jgi:F0F1-type ATP synthase delta subunit
LPVKIDPRLYQLYDEGKPLISSNIAKRYARAFFKIAGEEKRYEYYYDELGRFSAILKENKNLSEFLANPIFALSWKRSKFPRSPPIS